MVCYRQDGNMINIPTNFEMANFTRYGNIKGITRCRKWGGLGVVRGTQAYRQYRHLIERIRLPIRLQYKLYVYLYR